MRKLLACLLVVSASGCPDVKVDPGEGSGLPPVDGPTVEFDPSNAILPFPNNLVICPATAKDSTGAACVPGKLAIPKAACESPTQTAIRTGSLNKLDGFGTWETAMQVTFTTAVDAATLDGNIVMYQRTMGATSLDPANAMPIPLKLIKGTTLRFTEGACTTPATIDAVTIVPTVPLSQKSTYVVAVLAGVKTADGKDFLPSFTWALARQKDDPVTVDTSGNVTAEKTPLDPSGDATCATTHPLPSTCGDANHNGVWDRTELLGLDLVWKAHATGLAFLDGAGHGDRSTILVAFELTTQTTTDQLDPTVVGSPAANVTTTPLLGTTSVVPGGAGNTLAFMQGVLIQLGFATNGGDAVAKCAALGCAAVGNVLGAALPVATYQKHVPNPLAGGTDIPGAWNDPIAPMQEAPFASPPPLPAGALQVLAFIPNTAAVGPMPANGWPVVVFAHGITSQKEALFVFASQLAAAGFASVAIDHVNHGSRAIRFSTDAALGCGPGHCSATTTQACDPTAPSPVACPGAETCVGAPTFATAIQCYAPFLSADLANDRDNMRQSVIDQMRLIAAVKACGTTSCGALQIDPAHIEFAGQSLGSIFGSMVVSTQPDVKSAVLNVSGAGWLDILENTATLAFSCLLVDDLIDAGVLMGEKWNGSSSNPTGLCATSAWQMEPGYAQFSAVGRWVLDPADPANFMAKLAPKKFLIQEVMNDETVPNIATDHQGALAGLMPAVADPYNPLAAHPASAAIATSKWVRYPTLPATDATTGGFGNLFNHPSLLKPSAAIGHCVGLNTTTCIQDTDCAGLGNVCVFPGALGTARLQLDAITYLVLNK